MFADDYEDTGSHSESCQESRTTITDVHIAERANDFMRTVALAKRAENSPPAPLPRDFEYDEGDETTVDVEVTSTATSLAYASNAPRRAGVEDEVANADSDDEPLRVKRRSPPVHRGLQRQRLAHMEEVEDDEDEGPVDHGRRRRAGQSMDFPIEL